MLDRNLFQAKQKNFYEAQMGLWPRFLHKPTVIKVSSNLFGFVLRDILKTGVNCYNMQIPELFFEMNRNEANKLVDLSLVSASINRVTIYEIVGFNKLACSGPHVKNTREIGNFKILGIKKKGKNCFSINFAVN